MTAKQQADIPEIPTAGKRQPCCRYAIDGAAWTYLAEHNSMVMVKACDQAKQSG